MNIAKRIEDLGMDGTGVGQEAYALVMNAILGDPTCSDMLHAAEVLAILHEAEQTRQLADATGQLVVQQARATDALEVIAKRLVALNSS